MSFERGKRTVSCSDNDARGDAKAGLHCSVVVE